MRPGTKRNSLARLRQLTEDLKAETDRIEAAPPPKLDNVSVAWGVDGKTRVFIDDTYEYVIGVNDGDLVKLISKLAWALFEANRDMSNPSDPATLERVRKTLERVGALLPFGRLEQLL